MRVLKLLVGNACLLGVAFALTAHAADDPQGPSKAPAPEAVAVPAPAEPNAAEPTVSEPTAAEAAGSTATEAETGTVAVDPASDASGERAASPAAQAPAVLGEIAYDADGRPGRIHVVVRGDTLWDISDAYLGTPWVWPSVWTDNREIANPHRIDPGDHIWITNSEMRVLSPEEAAAMLAALPPGTDDLPAARSDFTNDGLGSASSPEAVAVPAEQRYQKVAVREWLGLVSAEEIEAAASIVRRVPEPMLLAQKDLVYIGLGDGDVAVGDQFDIVRTQAKVEDPETGRFLGYHVTSLGWLEVKEVHAEAALAEIRLSVEDIWEGDRVLPRQPESLDIAVQPSPEDVEGMIAFFPRERVVIGQLDFVYLNRGTLDGLESGSPLEVVRGGDTVKEPVRGTRVEVPLRVVAQLLVVNAQPETSVALIAHASTDLLVGDAFRGARD